MPNGGAVKPWRLFEFELCVQMGWTFDELDAQDAERVLVGHELWVHFQNGRIAREKAAQKQADATAKARARRR